MKYATFSKLSLGVLGLCLTIMLSACSTTASRAVTFTLDNGDSIKITVDAKAGYAPTTSVPFAITKDDAEISYGSFADAATYDSYKSIFDNGEDPNAVLLEESEKDGNDYLFYRYDGERTEYDYVIKVADSNSAVVLGSLESEDVARGVFEAITITVDE